MNIALFTDTYLPDINGVVTSIHTLRLALEKEGNTVYIVTTNQSISKTSFEDNVLRLPGLELRGLYGYRMSSPLHLSVMNNEIRKMELDVIHAHTEFGIGLFARICARILSVPLVSTYHTTYEDYTHYVNRLDIDFVDDIARNAVSRLSRLYVDSGQCVIAPSLKTEEMLRSYHIRSEIFVIPTGLELQKFDRSNTSAERIAEIREECGIGEGKMLLFLGRIAHEKSVGVLIEAMEYARADNASLKLVIIGDGPDLNEMKTLTEKKGLQDYVYFGGRKEASEVPAYYHAADIFASASMTETQGLTYIESLASSTVVCASDARVVEGLVIEDSTGYIFNDSRELYEKVVRHLSKPPAQQEEMAENALKLSETYDSRIFAGRVTEAYETAIRKYQGLLVIDKVRLKNDYVELFLESENLSVKVVACAEDYYNLGLRKNKPLTHEEYNYLLSQQDKVFAYDACVKKISVKDRTTREIRDYINSRFELNTAQTEEIISLLSEKKLLDDYRYAEEQFSYLSGLLNSYRSIRNKLLKKGVSRKIVEEVMEDEDYAREYENASEIAGKYVNGLHKMSVNMKKQKVKQKLYRDGFSAEVINDVVGNMEFVYDELQQNQILKDLYRKSYKRYSRKYQGHELRNSIYRYLVSQGFNHDRVYMIMSESEWDENEN